MALFFTLHKVMLVEGGELPLIVMASAGYVYMIQTVTAMLFGKQVEKMNVKRLETFRFRQNYDTGKRNHCELQHTWYKKARLKFYCAVKE